MFKLYKIPIQLATLGILLVLSSAYAPLSAGAQSGEFATYHNSELEISIQYPIDWQVDDESDESTIYFDRPAETGEEEIVDYIFVEKDVFESVIALDEYEMVWISAIEESGGTIVERSASSLGGGEARRIVGSLTFEDDAGPPVERKNMIVVGVRGNVGYTIALISVVENYPDLLPIAEQMIDSFQILPPVDEGPQEFVLYENPNQGFEIKYPSNWDKEESVGSTSYSLSFIDSSNGLGFVVAADILPESMTIEEYRDLQLGSLERVTSLFSIIESGPATLSGHAAQKVVYSGFVHVGDQLWNAKAVLLTTIVDNIGYSVSYVASSESFDAYEGTGQAMIDSFKIDTSSVIKPVSGIYSNEELDLQIELPEGWAGFEAPASLTPDSGFDNVVLIFAPSDAPEGSGEVRNASMIMMYSGELADLVSRYGSAGDDDNEVCPLPETLKIVWLDTNPAMKAVQADTTCAIPDVGVDMIARLYVLGTNENLFFLFFASSSEDGFNKNLPKFEDSVNSLKLGNTVDLSDPSVYLTEFGQELVSQQATAKGATYDLTVLTNSEIRDFAFSEENKQLSFRVEGASGPKGEAQIDIGMILEGPYAVTIDGVVADEGVTVLEDETTGITSVGVEYPPGEHEIQITGTTVVPEFPLAIMAAAGAVAAVIASGKLGTTFTRVSREQR